MRGGAKDAAGVMRASSVSRWLAICVATAASAARGAWGADVEVVQHVLAFPEWAGSEAATLAIGAEAGSAFAQATSRVLSVTAQAAEVVCACPAEVASPCVPEAKGCTRVGGVAGVQVNYTVSPEEIYSTETLKAAILAADYPGAMKAALQATAFPREALSGTPVSASTPAVIVVQRDVQAPIPPPAMDRAAAVDGAGTTSIALVVTCFTLLVAAALFLAYDEVKKQVVTVLVADATGRGRKAFQETLHVWDMRDPWPAIARRATLCAQNGFEDVGEIQLSLGKFHETEDGDAKPTIGVAREFDLFLSCFLHKPHGKQRVSRVSAEEGPSLEHQMITTKSGRHPIDIPFAWVQMAADIPGVPDGSDHLVAERLYTEESPTGVDLIRLRQAIAQGVLVGFVFVQKSAAVRGRSAWTRVNAVSHMIMANVRTRNLLRSGGSLPPLKLPPQLGDVPATTVDESPARDGGGEEEEEDVRKQEGNVENV